MKKRTIILTITAFIFGVCNTNQKELDEREDTGIRPERNYEKAEGDTTVTDEVNATGNAQSGPNEGP